MAEIPKSSQGSADAMQALLAEKRAILEKYHVSNEDMAKILEVSGGSETIQKTFPVGEAHVDVPISKPMRCKYGGFLKLWVSPTIPWGFPTKNDQHLGCFWGYHHLRKHPYMSMIFSLPFQAVFFLRVVGSTVMPPLLGKFSKHGRLRKKQSSFPKEFFQRLRMENLSLP